MSPNQLHVNLLLTTAGLHPGAGRRAGSTADSLSLPVYRALAETAERGLFDAVFLADSPSLPPNASNDDPIRVSPEPLTLLAALAATTSHVGLIGSASTSFYEPYNLARLFSSLDHLSGGRAGWNAVTTSSPTAARNFGQSVQDEHDARYGRAEEFIEVVLKLWDSFEPGSSVAHPIDHVGDRFSVAGPFTLPTTPQGRPVVAQAGSSPAGLRLGARFADVIYTNQASLQSSADFRREVRRQAADFGRDPDSVAVLPGVVPFLGSTEAEARRLKSELDDSLDTEALIPSALRWLGVDLSGYEPDSPFPIDKLPDPSSIRSSVGTFVQLADTIRREEPTVRQALSRVGGGTIHRTFVGTPEQLADDFESWFRAGAVDGFNVMPAVVPDTLDEFVDHVVPILQARGLFRHEYSASTLSGHYRSAVPA
ncbi:NtaA/DmoA family FMN-dependent monooxygenase [Rhodococcoides kyotonense]|uniref:FMN-dependent oxidoreductase, nitrilotriacetate monooxygenase family n=1 Tax=Rhodococcoides kyotonense TaxID=398843 RepID=A0A239GI45_9NOCA|nr:NtaA/DmoA family FMN-dependent monooxygenase [Rhodococcus kyotonensis]SNS67734.1 FMN-dependent oxidoreductase, nitrilotriacetate monooxygenase family [Rhodococcus kyotonensis]